MPIAPNTVAFWKLDNALGDASGNGHTLTNNGPVAFVTTPTPPVNTYWAGPYGVASYFSQGDADFSSMAAYTVEGYFRLPTLTGLNVIFSCYHLPATDVLMRITTAGVVRCVINNALLLDSAAGVVVANTNYYFALTFDGTTLNSYVSLASAISNTPVATGVLAATFPALATFQIGRDGSPGVEGPFEGYIQNVRVSNVARNTFPTLDTFNMDNSSRRGHS